MDHAAVSPARVEGSPAGEAVSWTEAAVCAGGVDTRYCRAGRGEPMVLLAAPGGPASGRDEIRAQAERFVIQHLVIIPTLPVNLDFDDWLRNFLEGLGVSAVHLIADRKMLECARRFAQSDASLVVTVDRLEWTATP